MIFSELVENSMFFGGAGEAVGDACKRVKLPDSFVKLN